MQDDENPSGGFFIVLLWTSVKPVQGSDKFSIHINVPTIVNTAFFHHIEICMCSPRHVNVFQWNRECFFSRYIELTSRLDMMTIK